MFMERKNYPLNNEFLHTFEQYLGFNFPKDYRNFILTYNGGEPAKKFFSYKEDLSDGSLIDYFFGLVPDEYENILLYWRNYQNRIPNNMFPIARDPGGNLIILSVKGPDRGKVYFWDHEMEAYEGEVPTYSNLMLLANSFEEFINSLHDIDET